MDSLPEQHIDSLPEHKREEAYRQVAMVCVFRTQGLPEDKVAEKAKFDSVEDMYFRLKRWGLSSLLPLGKLGKKEPELPEEDQGSTKPKARSGTKEHRALPPVSNAAELFRKALAKLAREVEELEHIRETYSGGRFVATNVYEGSLLLRREFVNAETWREFCEQADVNPEDDTLWQSGAAIKDPVGGAFRPSVVLAALIGTYLLAEEPLELLLEALHPDLQDADLKEISKYVEGRKKSDGKDGLKVLAGQIATLVRGGALKTGTPPVALAPREQNLACTITDYREAGLSLDEIHRRLEPLGLAKQDVRRLADMRLSWPED
jgi:hypothetical protein